MTEPLALVVYEKLLPGSQLTNRLQDMGYRVQTLSDPARLAEAATQMRPLVVLVDLEWSQTDVMPAIGNLRQNPATAHIPVIAFSGPGNQEQQKAAAAGVTLLASESAVLSQLPTLLQQALQVE